MTVTKKILLLALIFVLASFVLIGCVEDSSMPSPDGEQEENHEQTPGDDSGNGDNDTENGNNEQLTKPATVEYEQDYLLAESPDDMIFTCMGASNKTLAGSVVVEAVYMGEFPVVSIWNDAFAGCTGITDVTIAEGIAYIRQNAFAGCTTMTSIHLPSTIISIDMDAFLKCERLTDIHFAGTKAQWEAISKGPNVNPSVKPYTIHCIDGDIVVD